MEHGEDLTAGIGEDDGENDLVLGDSVAIKVMGIVSDVLHVPKSQIGIDTRAGDVAGWDSFGHVRIVLAVDSAFGIKLSMGAIEKADSVGALVDAVEEALGTR